MQSIIFLSAVSSPPRWPQHHAPGGAGRGQPLPPSRGRAAKRASRAVHTQRLLFLIPLYFHIFQLPMRTVDPVPMRFFLITSIIIPCVCLFLLRLLRSPLFFFTTFYTTLLFLLTFATLNLYPVLIMVYKPPKYPHLIPSHSTDTDDLPPWYDDLTQWMASLANALRLELCAVMQTLGTDPQGYASTVSTRISNKGAGCAISITETYDLTDNVPEYFPFDSIYSNDLFDDLNWHDPTINPSRITVSLEGKFLIIITLNAFITDMPSHGLILTIYKNNSPTYLTSRIITPYDDTQTISFSGILDLSPGDFIRLQVSAVGDDISIFPSPSAISLTFLRY